MGRGDVDYQNGNGIIGIDGDFNNSKPLKYYQTSTSV